MQKSHLDQTALQGFNQLVSARRSVRSFEPGEPIPKETLEKIADAGRWAPSGANSQPWEICVIEESERVRDVASLMASQAKPSQAKPSQAKPSQAKPSQAKPSQAKPSRSTQRTLQRISTRSQKALGA
jgi:nitroreductase